MVVGEPRYAIWEERFHDFDENNFRARYLSEDLMDESCSTLEGGCGQALVADCQGNDEP